MRINLLKIQSVDACLIVDIIPVGSPSTCIFPFSYFRQRQQIDKVIFRVPPSY